MSVFPGPDNAIVYAQFNLQGRWRRLLIVAGMYGLLIGGAIWLTALTTVHFHPRDLEGWVAGIAVLQVLNLLVFGSFRVESAVRGDVTSRMIESHRLMPSTPLAGILGYLIGAPLQALLLAGVNFLLGAVCCAISGLSLENWVVFNGLLYAFAICIHSMVAQFSFVARGGFMILLILSGFAVSGTNNGGLMMLPSANVLLAPLLSRESIFERMFGGSRGSMLADVSYIYACALIAWGAISLVAIRVAVRRYLSSTVVGFTGPLGLAMLAIWVALAVAQYASPDSFQTSRYFGYNRQESTTQTVTSFITSLLVAMFPIASAARAGWSGASDPLDKRGRVRFSQIWSMLAAGTIVCALLCDLPGNRQHHASSIMLSALIIFNFLVSIACVFSWGYLQLRRPWIYAILWLAFTWIAPVIADGIYRTVTNNDSNLTAITAISAPGALSLIWSDWPVVIQPGILMQLSLTIIPAALLLMAQRKARRRQSETTQLNIQPLAVN